MQTQRTHVYMFYINRQTTSQCVITQKRHTYLCVATHTAIIFSHPSALSSLSLSPLQQTFVFMKVSLDNFLKRGRHTAHPFQRLCGHLSLFFSTYTSKCLLSVNIETWQSIRVLSFQRHRQLQTAFTTEQNNQASFIKLMWKRNRISMLCK